MGNAALRYEDARALPTLTLVEPRSVIRTEILLLGFILSVIQVLDGVLTTMGVSNFGTHAEGNLLLRELMHAIGYVPALVVAKSLAIGIIGILCVLSKKIHWVSLAFKVVIGIYLSAAIIPWTVILFVKA